MRDIPVPIPDQPVRLVDQFRFFIRSKGLAYKTEQTYVHWLKAYILYHGKRHPKELCAEHVEAFLNHLAVSKNMAPNSQKTALNALAFFYNKFLQQDLGKLSFSYSKKKPRLPVVFSEQEARAVIEHLAHPYRLMAQIMYSSGLRISVCLRLGVKGIDFSMNMIIVRSGNWGITA